MPEVKLTILVDDQGTIKIKSLAGDLERLERAAKQTGAGVGAAGGQAATAAAHYDKLGKSVANAQAKMLLLYGAVRGGFSVFSNAMQRIDEYEQTIIRMTAASLDNLKTAMSGADLESYKEQQKAQFRELLDYIMQTAAKYKASWKDIASIAEYAMARGHTITKSNVDSIGLLIQKIRTLVPWIKQEGQVIQELNALWEGHARITDTTAKLVMDRLKAMGQITGEGAEAAKQFKEILESWKSLGFGGFIDKINELFKGTQAITKETELTWESTLEKVNATVDKLLLVAGKEIYQDIIKYVQEIADEYTTGAQALEKQQALAQKVGESWRAVKGTLSDLRPVVADLFGFLGGAWDQFNSLPPEIREVGIIGFFLVGSKGKMAIIAVLGLLDRVQTLLQSIAALTTGHMSISDFIFGNKDTVEKNIQEMEEYYRRLHNMRQFHEMEREPHTKSPIKIMSLEDSDNPFGSIEDLLELTGGARITKRGEHRPWGYIDDFAEQYGKAYEEIDSKRRRLDDDYYGHAVEQARGMAQEVGSIYDGMLAAARQYFAESNNMYRAGGQIFADFTRAGENLLGDFFDFIIWKTGSFKDAMTKFLKSLTSTILEQLVIKPIVGLIGMGLGSVLNMAVPGMGGIFTGTMFGNLGGATFGAGTGWESGSSGGGAMMGMMAALGIGGMAAMMSGDEGSASESSLSTMTVETIQVANLTVENLSLDGATVTGAAKTTTAGTAGQSAASPGGTQVDGIFGTLFSLLGWFDASGNVTLPGGTKPLSAKHASQWRTAFTKAGQTISGDSGGSNLLGGLFGGMLGVRSGEWDYLEKNQEMAQVGATFKKLGKGGDFVAIEGLGVTAALLEKAYVQKMEGAMPDWFNDEPGWKSALDSSLLGLTASLDNSAANLSASIYEAGESFRADIGAAGDGFSSRLSGLGGTGGGRGGGLLSGLGSLFGFFHDGGWIRAHDGMWLGRDEVPIIAQTRERVVSRKEVARVGGPKNLDAFLAGGSAGGGVNININVNALDGASVSNLDWERLIRSRIAPVLDKLSRRKV